jgi:cation transport ATPase
MTQDENPAAVQLRYLAKLLAGLAVIGSLVALALWLSQQPMEASTQRFATAVLLLLALGLVPWVRWVYRQRDEMLQRQHQRSSMHALVSCAAVCAAVGVLQAADWLPLFSQFWTLGGLIGTWAVHLVWADSQDKP